jgi:hypothetical protein
MRKHNEHTILLYQTDTLFLNYQRNVISKGHN